MLNKDCVSWGIIDPSVDFLQHHSSLLNVVEKYEGRTHFLSQL